MIKFNELLPEDRYILDDFLDTYDNFRDTIKSKPADEHGFINTKFDGMGNLSKSDAQWIKAAATDYRKLVSTGGNEPLTFTSIRKKLSNILYNGTEKEKEKGKEIISILKEYEKRFWDQLLFIVKFQDQSLSSFDITEITHNAYIFHSGLDTQTKLLIKSVKIAYPKSNPIISDYLHLMSMRLHCLSVLAICIEAYKEDQIMNLELNPVFAPKFKMEQDIIIIIPAL